MASKTKDGNKNTLIGSVCAVVAICAIVLVIVLLINNNKLNDSYFVSDGSKYVITLETNESGIESQPVKTYLVYTYSGDTITGLKTYEAYVNENAAKKVYDEFMAGITLPDEIKKYELNGKYIIAINDEDEYKHLSISDVKQHAENEDSDVDYQEEDDMEEGDMFEVTDEVTEEDTGENN